MSELEHPSPRVALEVRRGAPTDEELAAIVAVVSDAYAGEDASALAAPKRTTTAWQRSARAPRSVPAPGAAWDRFEG